RHQPVLAALQQGDDHVDPAVCHANLGGNLGIIVAAPVQAADFFHEVDRPVLSARDILDQAHHQAFGLGRLDYDGGDLGLPEHLECLEPPFAAHQIVSGTAFARTPANRDRAFEADRLDVVHDLTVLPLVAGP